MQNQEIKCSICKNEFTEDELGALDTDELICDGCSETLEPNRYHAELPTIVRHVKSACWKLDNSLDDLVAEGRVAIVEDYDGDLVYSSRNVADIFISEPAVGSTAVYYLPDEMRLEHHSKQRQSVRSLEQCSYITTTQNQHWSAQILPFEVEGENFTLALLRRITL
jgi:hypothetical protein